MPSSLWRPAPPRSLQSQEASALPAQARVLQQYVQERSVTPLALNYDFALITLSEGAPAGTTYLDIAAGQGTQTFNLTTAGYPADKNGQDMWTVRVCVWSPLQPSV